MAQSVEYYESPSHTLGFRFERKWDMEWLSGDFVSSPEPQESVIVIGREFGHSCCCVPEVVLFQCSRHHTRS